MRFVDSKRNDITSRSMHRGWRVWPAVFVAGALIGAACGGGSGKKAADNVTTTSTTAAAAAAEDATTTTVGTAQAGGTASPGALASTTTTAGKKTSATTARLPIAAAPPPKSLNSRPTKVTSAPTTAPPADVQAGGTITYLKVPDITGFDPSVLTYSG